MCGIVGYVGKENAIDKLIKGLKTLEYRGYDSAGVAILQSKKINTVKDKGRISNLEMILNTQDLIGNTGIATLDGLLMVFLAKKMLILIIVKIYYYYQCI